MCPGVGGVSHTSFPMLDLKRQLGVSKICALLAKITLRIMRPLYERTPTMDKIDFAKKTVSFIVGLGTSKIVRDIIKNNVDVETVIDQVTVTSTSFVIGSMVKEATREYTDAKIDKLVNKIEEIKAKKKDQNQSV